MSSSAISCPKKEQHASGKGQSFLQALSGTTHNTKQESVETYVHPLVKKLSAKLSDKSLEMCTESLGSETGSEIMNEPMINSSLMIHRKETKIMAKIKRHYNFPPPLTLINDSVSVKSYRENGRLIINTVVFTESSNSLFHAERLNGRLTLRMKNAGSEKGDEFEDGKSEIEDEGGEGETEHSVSWDKDMEFVEGKTGIDENVSRLGRCNEAGEERRGKGHLWNSETCWVAI
ncbi:hypothetical protein QQ045_003944 [Rhodiola kirilowii]